MKKTTLLATALLAGFAATAQISITSGTMTYTQDFNTLSMDTASKSDLMPTGWSFAEFGNSASIDGKYRVGNGSTNNGDTYSFGTHGASDRALGSIASNSLSSAFGATFVNNTGADLLGFTLSYTGEQWRLGNATEHRDSLIFQYSTAGLAVSDSNTASVWMMDTTLMFSSVITSGTSGPLDGNDPENQMMKTGEIMFATPVPDGGSFTIRWKDINIIGSDDGLAIDDLSMTFMVDSTATSVGAVRNNQTKLAVLGEAVNGNVRLGYTLQQAGALRIEIRDMNGRVLHQETVSAQAGTQQYQISNAALAAGTYVIRISNGKEAGVIKMSMR